MNKYHINIKNQIIKSLNSNFFNIIILFMKGNVLLFLWLFNRIINSEQNFQNPSDEIAYKIAYHYYLLFSSLTSSSTLPKA
jgi:hypothetical protein